jgi:chromosome segregation ATPase
MYAGTFSHTDPAFAEKFLAAHLRNYLESEIGKSIKVLSSEVELLRQQYQDNEEQLRQQEEGMREYKEGNLDALPEVADGQVANRAQLLMRRDTLSADLTRASEQLALVRRQLASEDAFVGTRVQQSAPYEERLVQIRQQIAEAKAKGLAEGHPDLVKLRSEEQSLMSLRDQALNAETTETDRRANPEHKRLQNDAGQLQVQVAATSKELSQVEGRLAEIAEVTGKMPEVEVEMAQKFRQLHGSKKLHEELHSQLKAKELEYQFERASVAARYEVMKPPEAFDLNYTRSTIKRAVAGFVFGAMLGIGLALLHWLRVYARNRRERLAAAR